MTSSEGYNRVAGELPRYKRTEIRWNQHISSDTSRVRTSNAEPTTTYNDTSQLA